MQRRQNVNALSSMSVEDMAHSKPWTGPREIRYPKPRPPEPKRSTEMQSSHVGQTSVPHDVEVVGQKKVEEALEQVAALIASAEEEGVEPQQVEALRKSMEQLLRAL
jgi:hypothetical protein